MVYLSLLILFISSFAFAETPRFPLPKTPDQIWQNDLDLSDKIQNISLKNTAGGSCIDEPTFCVNETSNSVGIGISTPVGKGLSFYGQGLTVTQDGDGDLWITANAYFDGTNWQRENISNYSFGLELIATGNFPGENEPGAAMWRVSPGANPISTTFGAVGGWELGWDVTAFRDFVIGGRTIEMDGAGLSPFGRFFHSNATGPAYTGVVTNLFGDLAGADVPGQPAWMFARKNDTFVIQRASDATEGNLQYFMEASTQADTGKNITVYGHLISSGSVPSVSSCGTTPSIIGNDFVGTVTVGSGGIATSCTVTFAKTWTNQPTCTSSNEGAILFTRNTTTTTTLVIDASSTLTAGGKLKYSCVGYQ